MQITIYTQEGKESSKMTLPKEIFEVPVNEVLIHKMLMLQEANNRQAIAHTKTRGEVAGSTRKITVQKGRGAARQGPRTSGVRRGGGVIFGPRSDRNFTKTMPKKERRKALFSALSSRAQEKKIFGLEGYEGEISTKNFVEVLMVLPEKNFVEMLEKLPVGQKVLMVLPEKNDVLEKSSRNVPNVKTILANYLNVKDVLHYESMLFLKDAFKSLEDTFIAKA